MRHFVHALLAVAIVVPVAIGQQPRAQGQVRQAQFFQGSGTIHSYDAQQINMMTAGNQPWVIKLDEKTSISVKGEGTEEMMRPGSVVRFYAKLSKRGAAIEPISEITLMTPREGFTPMIEAAPEGEDKEESEEVKKQLRGAPEQAPGNEPKKEGDQPKEGEEKKPGVVNPFDNIGLSEDKESSRGRGAKGRRGGNELEEGERYFVVGLLVSARRGKLVVNAGDKMKVKAELADDAAIKVDFTTHAMARKGDKLEVKGYFFDQGEAFANSVEITLAPPEEEEEVHPKRANRNNRRERADRDKDEPQEEGAPGFGPRPRDGA